jgi:hypothetical protein
MFQYYDFQANWTTFLHHLRSPEITAILKDNGLSHPLFRCSRGSGIHDDILRMAQEDPQYQTELDNLDLDSEEDLTFNEECNTLLDKYLDKYSDDNLLYVNVPTGRCHQLAPALFAIAYKMHPEKEWIHLHGNRHSTVLCVKEGIVFDLIFYYLQTCMKEPTTAEHLYLSSIAKKIGEDECCNDEFEVLNASHITIEDATLMLQNDQSI